VFLRRLVFDGQKKLIIHSHIYFRRIKARGTELEKRLLEAMSNENWGASSSLLNQLAQDTYD
jgi:hypothetical protein